ncbi:unnamed protein product [Arabis nemorensis]|uniref:Uncharacterized protein n=1 Tax=Arabis nemorensis TaxID=586526 RepID=A0A565BS73_9BRAS|nr:unnamed protein product [Arabis nemorensis]
MKSLVYVAEETLPEAAANTVTRRLVWGCQVGAIYRAVMPSLRKFLLIKLAQGLTNPSLSFGISALKLSDGGEFSLINDGWNNKKNKTYNCSFLGSVILLQQLRKGDLVQDSDLNLILAQRQALCSVRLMLRNCQTWTGEQQ